MPSMRFGRQTGLSVVDMNELSTNSGGELGVEVQHLDRERHLVDYPLAGAVAAVEKLQVPLRVVPANPVLVVDGFLFEEFSAELLGHDVSVLENGVLLAGDEARDGDQEVAVSGFVPRDVPALKSGQGLAALVRRLARSVAELLLHVHSTARLASATLLLPALEARKPLSVHRVFSSADIRTGFRAIHRVFAESLAVCAHNGRFVGERISAFFAGKFGFWNPRPLPAMDPFVGSLARSRAKSLTLMGKFHRKGPIAVFTTLLNAPENLFHLEPSSSDGAILSMFGNGSLGERA